MDASDILLEILILIGTTTVFATVFHYLRLPTIVGFILAGIFVGPFGSGWVDSVPGAHLLTEIGIVFLLFTIGLEFSFERLKHLKSAFLRLGVTQVVGTLVLTALIVKGGFGYTWAKSLFFGCLVALSSTAIVMKLLQDSREITSPYGNATTAILICQDLAVLGMILALPLFVEAEKVSSFLSMTTVLGLAGRFLVLVVVLWVGNKFVFPYLLERVAQTRSRELFFSATLLLCFGVAFVVKELGMSLSIGAFLAGLTIAETPYGRQAASDLLPLRDNILGIFFASVGMLVDLRFLIGHIHWVLLIVVGVFVFKVAIIYLLGRLNRYPTTTALITGLMLFQIGEFSFILADRGAILGLLSPAEMQYFLAVSVITLMLTPFIFRAAPRLTRVHYRSVWRRFGVLDRPKGLEKAIEAETDQTEEGKGDGTHTVILGFGVVGQNLAFAMKALGIPYRVVTQQIDAVKQFKKYGEAIFYGDATREDILKEAGIENARLVVVAVSGSRMTCAIVESIRRLRPDVHIIIRAQYTRECEVIGPISNADIVVAENETTIEILGRALNTYGVSGDEIQVCMTKTRQRLRGSLQDRSISDMLRQTVELPNWKALATVRPIRIGEEWQAVGRSFADLHLSRSTGATAVAVFRQDMGTTVPKGDFVLQPGDVVHLIGEETAIDNAEKWLIGQTRE